MEKKILYVDFFNADKSMAITKNRLSVSYNLFVLDRLNPESSPIFTVGKYVCIVWATNPPVITFLDLRKNPDVAMDIINSPDMKDMKNQFISLIESYNSTYEATKNYVELVLGESPAKPIK